MALFGLKKEKKKEEALKKVKDSAVPEKKEEVKDAALKKARGQRQEKVSGKDVSSVLARPRITEKATTQAEKNVYVFEVNTGASKRDIKDAIANLYKVHPVKVHVVKMKPRKVVSRMRGTRGTKAGYKKAYVYLKEGDRIEII